MSSVISNISYTSLQAYVPSIFNHILPGDDVSHDITRDVYIIRDMRGNIRGSYNPNGQTFVEGLPAWLDPMNQAAIKSVTLPHGYAETTVSVMDPVAEETISEGVEISPPGVEVPAEEPEQVIDQEEVGKVLDALLDALEAHEPVIAVADSPQADEAVEDQLFDAEATISGEGESERFDEIEAELEASLVGRVRVALPDDNDNAADVDPVAALLAAMDREIAAKKSQGDMLLDMMLEAARKGELQSFHFSTVSGISAGWSA